MKKSFFLIFIVMVLATASCKKDQVTAQPTCNGDCLFALSNAVGAIVHLDCFDRYAIRTSMNEDGQAVIYGILDDMGEGFTVEGKMVRFSATFHENDLTPTFPDPAIGMESLYHIELTMIEDL